MILSNYAYFLDFNYSKIAMYTNTCMFCVVYSSILKFTIITIMKTAIFITIIFVISILSNYLNYRTALPDTEIIDESN